MYAVESGTDGVLNQADLGVIAHYQSESTNALIAAGIFAKYPNGSIVVVDFQETQTSAAEMRQRTKTRIVERERKQRQRARPKVAANDRPDEPPLPTTEWKAAPIPGADPN